MTRLLLSYELAATGATEFDRCEEHAGIGKNLESEFWLRLVVCIQF
jgi:hypothetical protein